MSRQLCGLCGFVEYDSGRYCRKHIAHAASERHAGTTCDRSLEVTVYFPNAENNVTRGVQEAETNPTKHVRVFRVALMAIRN